MYTRSRRGPAPLLSLLLLTPGLADAAEWPSPAQRGWIETSGILHLHSPWSHDACDDDPLDTNGQPKAWCLADLRADMCSAPHTFYNLTDHRTHMADQPFEDLFHVDAAAGDRLLYTADGGILANEITCDAGPTPRKIWLTVGLEGSHNMPIGLSDHLEDPDLYGVGFGDGTDLELQLAEIDAVHTRGGLAMLAHAEEDDVTVERLLELGLDGLELYNAHSNIGTLIDTHPLKAMKLEGWLPGAEDAPESDYLALLMFPNMAQEPRQKWDRVLPLRELNGVIGTDVHQNVFLPTAYCSIPELARTCERLARKLPNTVAYLEEGGPVPLADGDRLDSYLRMFRWFSNHVWVRELGITPALDALAVGRGQVVFDILGRPEGWDLVATLDHQTYAEQGAVVSWRPGWTLHAVLPTLGATDTRGDVWTPEQQAQAEIRARVLKIDVNGVEEVATLTEARPSVDLPVEEPAVYRMEVLIRPHHLEPLLGAQPQLAHREYDWVWTNPLYFR